MAIYTNLFNIQYCLKTGGMDPDIWHLPGFGGTGCCKPGNPQDIALPGDSRQSGCHEIVQYRMPDPSSESGSGISLVESSLKMFADDTKLWRPIKDYSDSATLQNDLNQVIRMVQKMAAQVQPKKMQVDA